MLGCAWGHSRGATSSTYRRRGSNGKSWERWGGSGASRTKLRQLSAEDREGEASVWAGVVRGGLRGFPEGFMAAASHVWVVK